MHPSPFAPVLAGPGSRGPCRRAARALSALLALATFAAAAGAAPGAASGRARPAAATPSPAPRVTGVRTSSEGGRTRVVIEMSRQASYVASTREAPSRIVIDIPGGRVAVKARRYAVGDSLVSAVRLNQLRHGAQVVVDLRKKTPFRHFTVEPDAKKKIPFRIVVDVGAGQPPSAREEPAREAPPEVKTPVAAASPAPLSASAASPETLAASAPGTSPDTLAVSSPAASPAAQPASPPPARAGAARREPVIVVIDAGHGGDDPGATGPRGLREKEVTLRIARALERRLEREPGIQTKLTRRGDKTVSLLRRQQLVEEVGGDLLVSIHVNASPNRQARGAEIYYLSLEASRKESARAAARAGGPEGGAESDLDRVLSGLSHAEGMMLSGLLAEALARELQGLGRVELRKVMQAGFQVLKLDGVPAVLVEVGFFSNRQEARSLADPKFAEEVADCLARGIRRFVEEELEVRPSAGRDRAAAEKG